MNRSIKKLFKYLKKNEVDVFESQSTDSIYYYDKNGLKIRVSDHSKKNTYEAALNCTDVVFYPKNKIAESVIDTLDNLDLLNDKAKKYFANEFKIIEEHRIYLQEQETREKETREKERIENETREKYLKERVEIAEKNFLPLIMSRINEIKEMIKQKYPNHSSYHTRAISKSVFCSCPEICKVTKEEMDVIVEKHIFTIVNKL
jgi:hypothetical protein